LNIPKSIPIVFERLDNDTPNSRFTPVKIWIMHTGINLNGSVFDKPVIEKMIPTLEGIPIVGYISKNKDNEMDFNGHEEILVIQKGEIKFEYIGRAYGFIGNNNDAKFEMKLCDDGVEREFLTCLGILWNKFEDCKHIFDRDKFKEQSLELNPSFTEGYFNNEDKLFHFTDAVFDAACILGADVSAAMKGSVVEKYSRSNSLREQFRQLIIELKEFEKTDDSFTKDDWGTGSEITIKNDKESANMTTSWGDVDKTELRNKILKASNYKSLVKEVYLIVEDGWEDAPSEHLKYPHHMISGGSLVVSKDGIETALSFLNNHDPDNTSAKSHLKKHYKELGLPTDNFKEDFSSKGGKDSFMKVYEKFGLTSNQMYDIFSNAVRQVKYQDGCWGESSRYYVEGYNEEYVYVWDCMDQCTKGMKYSIDNLVATVDFESAIRVINGGYIPVNESNDGSEINENAVKMMEVIKQDAKSYTETNINSNLEQLSTEKAELESQVTGLMSQIEAKNTEIEEMKCKNQSLEQEKVDINNNYTVLNDKYVVLNDSYAVLEASISDFEALKQFKADKIMEEKIALIESFSSALTVEEIEPIKTKMAEMDIETIKKELFAIVGEKNIKDKFSQKDSDYFINLGIKTPPAKEDKYDSIFNKYLNVE